MTSPVPERPMTIPEVAEYLSVSERTLEGWRLSGKGPRYIRLGIAGRAKILYHRREIDAWLEKNSFPPSR